MKTNTLSKLAMLLVLPMFACDPHDVRDEFDPQDPWDDDDGWDKDKDDKDKDDEDKDKDTDDKVDKVDKDGKEVYWGTFVPLNDSGVEGSAAFIIEDGKFTAIVDAGGLAPDIVHLQHVHYDKHCPTKKLDKNDDGFLDVLEGLPAYGPILIPLDDDLSAQIPGEYPLADGDGNIDYKAWTQLDALLSDLMAADPDPNDAIVKLQPGEDLNLDVRTVVLHGIDPNVVLPDTVGTLGDIPPNVTLPVACAQIVKVDH